MVLTFEALSTTIVVSIYFFQEHHDLQMFGLKLSICEYFLLEAVDRGTSNGLTFK